MDNEAKEAINARRKKRAIKVAITEGLMVLAVAALVVVTTFMASGYNFTKTEDDWAIERSGLVAIRSIPTGATVTLDGETLFAWTNMSRTMIEGEHEITLAKDGYDSWTKKINVSAGLYYRLNYPRLFLSERETEIISDLNAGTKLSLAKNRDYLLIYSNDLTSWQLARINEEKPTFTKLDVSSVFSAVGEGFNVEVKAWSADSEKVLLQANNEWVLFNTKKPEISINLTETFGKDFTNVRIENDAADRLLALENGNLRELNLSTKEMSDVLMENVDCFENSKTNLALVINGEVEKTVMVYKLGETSGTEVRKLNGETKVGVSEYYGAFYLAIANNEKFQVLKMSTFPSYGTDMDMELESVEKEIGFSPSTLEVNGAGELILVKNGSNTAVYDAEKNDIENFTTASEVKWFDENMLVENDNGKMIVMDFDALNQKTLAEDMNGRFAGISKNNKWVYYLNNKNQLARIVVNQ